MTDPALRKTSLYDRHVKAGARMVPFTGFEMPVQYTGIVDEHQAVRTACGTPSGPMTWTSTSGTLSPTETDMHGRVARPSAYRRLSRRYVRSVPDPSDQGDLGEVVNERVFDWIVAAVAGLLAWAVLRRRRRRAYAER